MTPNVPLAASMHSWGGDLLRNLEREGDLAGLFGDLTGDRDFPAEPGECLNLFGDISGESAILLDLWLNGDLLLKGTGDESEEVLQGKKSESYFIFSVNCHYIE